VGILLHEVVAGPVSVTTHSTSRASKALRFWATRRGPQGLAIAVGGRPQQAGGSGSRRTSQPGAAAPHRGLAQFRIEQLGAAARIVATTAAARPGCKTLPARGADGRRGQLEGTSLSARQGAPRAAQAASHERQAAKPRARASSQARQALKPGAPSEMCRMNRACGLQPPRIACRHGGCAPRPRCGPCAPRRSRR